MLSPICQPHPGSPGTTHGLQISVSPGSTGARGRQVSMTLGAGRQGRSCSAAALDPCLEQAQQPGEPRQVGASVALTQPGAAEPRSSVCIEMRGGDEPTQITASPLSPAVPGPALPRAESKVSTFSHQPHLETCPDSRGMKDSFRVSSDSRPGTGTERFVFLSPGQTSFHLLGKIQTLATWGDAFPWNSV